MLSPEEQLLNDFFEAARIYDTTVMARLSAMPLNPRTDGIVDAFDVERVERAADDSERVLVAARVRTFNGQTTTRTMTFTVGHEDGRWFIRSWQTSSRRP